MLVMLGVAFAMPASAQRSPRALAGSVPRGELPGPSLTLRPSPELLPLAVEAAEVLELRTGQRVEIGDPPPPGLMEAVPAGHVALAVDAHGTIVIVLGAAGGLSHDTVVRLGGQSGEHVDARAVALAVEALRDLAMESAPTVSAQQPTSGAAASDKPSSVQPSLDQPPSDQGPAPMVAATPVRPGVAPQAEPLVPGPLRDEGEDGRHTSDGFLGDVQPFAFVRAYSGASLASPGPRMGLGTGLGLCVMRQCLVVFGEVPMNLGPSDPVDTRYQYTTFGSAFYSRPFQWGHFSPGASVGFVTRLGYFEHDMGLPSDALQTDLGARATLEMGYEIVRGLDVLAEGGADLMLDRLKVQSGDRAVTRGDRLTPWMQGSLRYRL
jgi:hypothetical protein